MHTYASEPYTSFFLEYGAMLGHILHRVLSNDSRITPQAQLCHPIPFQGFTGIASKQSPQAGQQPRDYTDPSCAGAPARNLCGPWGGPPHLKIWQGSSCARSPEHISGAIGPTICFAAVGLSNVTVAIIITNNNY